MTAAELRKRRKEVGLSQAIFAKRLGLSRDYIGQMERGAVRINDRIAGAVLRLCADEKRSRRQAETLEAKVLRKLAPDPMEYEIETALREAGIPYEREGQVKGREQRLDFYLPEHDVFIEVKQFHTRRAGEQLDAFAEHLGRPPNVILAAGRPAVELLATAIRQGLFS